MEDRFVSLFDEETLAKTKEFYLIENFVSEASSPTKKNNETEKDALINNIQNEGQDAEVDKAIAAL
jgi:hypothetical protein